MQLSDLYKPLTAHPFERTTAYFEAEPCAALKPYIRCFWGTVHPFFAPQNGVSELVTPDTCCDVIFTVNHTEGTIESAFCGTGDISFASYSYTQKPHLRSVFAVRFYAWSAAVFSGDTLRGTKNETSHADSHFAALRREIEPRLFETTALSERIRLAESFLLSHMRPERNSAAVQNAIYEILIHRGNLKTESLSRSLHISQRQLERRFHEETGFSPKQLSELIRYQYLWDGVLHHRFHSLADAALELGYTDQAHLARDFKRFHTLTIREALQYAEKDVVFLQDKSRFSP
ncbi:MAG: AraC family transcriptional regulator [Clostridia bacterium]|nr:AraC family transcriptional regulator [Clostridia bacterium]